MDTVGASASTLMTTTTTTGITAHHGDGTAIVGDISSEVCIRDMDMELISAADTSVSMDVEDISALVAEDAVDAEVEVGQAAEA